MAVIQDSKFTPNRNTFLNKYKTNFNYSQSTLKQTSVIVSANNKKKTNVPESLTKQLTSEVV